MRYQLAIWLPALTSFLGIAPSARADVFIRAPFVQVQVGQPGVYVGVFGRPIVVVNNAPGPRRTSVRRDVLPAPKLVPAVEGPVPTLSEFVGSFKPRAGKYEVVVLHPVTEQPVSVSFKLPAGKPQSVKVQRRGLEFEYADREVSIRFLRDGRVRVLYD